MMANLPGRNPYNPLLVGAIAVIVALAAFLIFREGTGPTQQAGIESPPTITSPAKTPNAGPPGAPNPAPTTPDQSPAQRGSGAQ
jgi:hypothetical protein